MSLREQVIEDYAISADELEPFEVLYHYYEIDGYSGTAFTLLRSHVDGTILENEGSHCSCMGLEDQFTPGRTNKAALLRRFSASAEHHPCMPFRPYYDKDGPEVARFRALVEAL